MASLRKLLPLTSFYNSLSISITVIILITPTLSVDHTSLIFKGCANQKFQDPTSLQNLDNLFDTLTSQSSEKSFSTSISGDTQSGISGLYQCRGDLTLTECHSCVSKIPELANKVCGKVVAARIHLNGCYLKYEVSGFKQVSNTELLYKVCRPGQVSVSSGFEEKRDVAFGLVINAVKSSLFYTGNYETVFVLGQCEGDLTNEDCGDCIKSAVENEKSECGDSISGQVYLNKCYISFSYYPNGVPSISSVSDVGRKHHTQKTVAIVVGGVAALGFLLVCLLCVKSHMGKHKRQAKYEIWG